MIWLALLTLLALAHLATWIYVINRLHATAIPYGWLKLIDALWYAVVLGGLALIGLAMARHAGWSLEPFSRAWTALPPRVAALVRMLSIGYAGLMAVSGSAVGVSWFSGRRQHRAEQWLGEESRRRLQLDTTSYGRSAEDWLTRCADWFPGNQVFELVIHQRTLVLPGMPRRLAGTSITHLSDLHFTGRTAKGFYRTVVELANELNSDFVVVTGDIIDKPRCLPWLADVLGQLMSRSGKFFVLGNHDLRVRDETRVRRELESVGFHDLGGRTIFTDVGSESVLWAGNELPWFSPAADPAQAAHDPRHARALRVAVSHSPDQITWARAHRFHLMLAGHTHGGQIRLPLVGPVFSPSRFGVRYASGTFFAPPTMLHVSRGLSGTRPIRIGCPAELTQLVLQPDTGQPGSAGGFERASEATTETRTGAKTGTDIEMEKNLPLAPGRH